MNLNPAKILLLVALAFIAIACSTKRDTFLGRKYHALTTEYNVLFNGQEAFDKYYLDLNQSFVDNYWDILPVEPFVFKENDDSPTLDSKSTDGVSRAEEKATKAIQKHSMYINGQERNTQADEAYLLLGKTRYYDNRFLPAIEAFNYVIYKSPEANTVSEIIIWRERANIKLNNSEEAIVNLKELLQTDDINFKKEVVVDANAVLAQAYYNTTAIDTAINRLTIARSLTKDKEKKSRFSYILGQLHKEFNQPDSAFYYFQEVIDMKRKAKRIYTMQSYAQQATLFDYEKGDTVVFLEKFNELLIDRENRPYLYILTHQLGNFYKHYKEYDKATKFYKQSIKADVGKDQYLLASNYRQLGQINFDEHKFKMSAKYYDSCLTNLKAPSKEYSSIQRKIKNIDEVIKYEDIVFIADSTIAVYKMTEPERVIYFSKYIEDIKAVDLARALKAKEEAQEQSNIADNQFQALNVSNSSSAISNGGSNTSMMPPAMPPGGDIDQSVFYYYVPASVQQGKLNFERKWGKRSLKDNWRWSEAGGSNSFSSDSSDENGFEDDSEDDEEKPLIDLDAPKYDIKTYLDKVVTDPSIINELAKNRNSAYYELGYIYDDKFQEYQLAANSLESLLNSEPEKGLVLPTLYNLYKIYNKLDSDKALNYRERILSEYPETHYAKVLLGQMASKDEDPESVYTAVYRNYIEKNDPVASLNEVNEKIDFYNGTPIIVKFELFKARLLAKNYGISAYKEALNNLVNSYPLTNEGKEAKIILEKDIPNLEAYEFTDKDSNQWKLIYNIETKNQKEIENLVEVINKYIEKNNFSNLKVSVDFYTPQNTLIVVHGFYSDAGVKRFATELTGKDYKIKLKGIPITLNNYIVIQTHKNLESYIELNK